jgi:hypothetical protein
MSAAAAGAGSALEQVSELLQAADALAAEIGYPDATLRAAYHRQVLLLLAQAHAQLFATHIESPDWVPHTGPLFPWGAPNPDTIYRFAPIDARGCYRISGTRGTETVASIMFRKGGANTGEIHGATLGEIDVLALPDSGDGRFSVLLSAERPAAAAAPWFALPPQTTGIITRHVTEVPEQREGIWCLERLDRGPRTEPLGPQETAQRTAHLTSFVRRLNEFLLRLVKRLRDGGYTNALLAERFQGNGGIADQMYFQGLFELAADQALIIESELPASVRYWSVQLFDPFYSAIDFIFHSATYNARQAYVSADGKVRFVLALSDPGVPNWLDPAGWTRGGLLWRWHSASSAPVPQLQRVPLTAVRGLLPPATPHIDAAARAAERAVRITHYQGRRRW